ncbi:uncharacterized protein LOC110979416 [Acanthaster planci]|uniref:Uncharacterized protein LOC110979416 n=1 Tax=Acanthaster planci TaxID=133434 RepID=A0A8B7YE80_ACAPL|nr:uncharacterized protein LOC110979416 [Acanthaster planci]XP_022090882.1 uncharacterized protein LOC110979416 [Acanthaster planci]
MGCVESSNQSPAKRSQSTASHGARHNGSRAKASQTRQGVRQMNAFMKTVDIATQTEETAGLLLRRLSSRIKQRHRRSTRGQNVEPPDRSLLFDLNRSVALTHSKVADYIDQALAMPGERRGPDAGQSVPNGTIATSDQGPLSDRDKSLVQGCWKEVRKDLVELGVDLFVRLLEDYPTLRDLFPFGKLNLSTEKLRHNQDLRGHGQRVMETIGTAVEGLDEWELIVPLLEDLGARHKGYGAAPEHFVPLEEAFMFSMRNGLPPKVFTSEVQGAWKNFWKAVIEIMSETMRTGRGFVENHDEGPISPRDKRLVQGSWKAVEKDLDNLGAALFVRLLGKNPAIKYLFPFGKLNLSPENLQHNPDLRAHGKGVMETIGTAVNTLNELDKLVPFLKDLGARHKAYGAKPEHFKPLAEAFMLTLKDGLPPKVFNSDVQGAWENVLQVVAEVMSSTMRTDSVENGPVDGVEGPVSSKDKQLVQESWKIIQKDLVNLGAVLFARLLEKNPSVQKLFTFGKLNLPPEKLRQNPDLRAHGKGVMETIGSLVTSLDDIDKVVPMLEDLGSRHKIYGAKPEHFPAVVEAFMYSMKNGLSPKAFTSEVQEAWRNILKVVEATMGSTMRSDKDGVSDKKFVSQRDQKLVQGSWKLVQKDIVNFGAVMFARLLEKNPGVQKLFTFGKLNLPPAKLQQNPDLRAHGKGVMETIGTVVTGLDDLEKIFPVIEDLGARHKMYGAKPEHFPAVVEAFMYSLKNGLSPKVFTSEVQEAWRNVLKVVDVVMTGAMRMDENGNVGDGPISSREKELVQTSWKIMQKDSVNLGAAIFARLLDKNPSIRELFPFGKSSVPLQMLKRNPDLRAHGKGVMETIGSVVAGLDDLGKIVPVLKDLGARHKIYGAKPGHFKPLMEAFMYSARNGLPPKAFTSDVQEAWGNTWKVLAGIMNTTME